MCACDESICGFPVLPLPEKPDYIPLSDEEFKRETLSAWCRGGHDEKITAALRGGEHEWAILCHDADFFVRAAVTCKASEDIQMEMLGDPEPLVRKWLAIYGTDRVRLALLSQRESAPEVLVEIANWGNVQARNRILPLAWDKPDVLCKITPYLGTRGLRLLEKHPDLYVRFEAAMHGSLAQGKRFWESIKNDKSPACWLMRENLSYRLEELEKIASVLQGGRVRTMNLGVER